MFGLQCHSPLSCVAVSALVPSGLGTLLCLSPYCKDAYHWKARILEVVMLTCMDNQLHKGEICVLSEVFPNSLFEERFQRWRLVVSLENVCLVTDFPSSDKKAAHSHLTKRSHSETVSFRWLCHCVGLILPDRQNTEQEHNAQHKYVSVDSAAFHIICLKLTQLHSLPDAMTSLWAQLDSSCYYFKTHPRIHSYIMELAFSHNKMRLLVKPINLGHHSLRLLLIVYYHRILY